MEHMGPEEGDEGPQGGGLSHLIPPHNLAVDDHRPKARKFRKFLYGPLHAGKEPGDGLIAVAVGQKLEPFPAGKLHGGAHRLVRHDAVAAASSNIGISQPGGAALGRAVLKDLKSGDFQMIPVSPHVGGKLLLCGRIILRRKISRQIQP